MKAAFIEKVGPPAVIQYGDLPTPTLAAQQVLVQMKAVAVNPIDTYIRNGSNYWELPQPFIIGCDIAGVVAEVGAGASRFKVGDRVWGSNQGLLGRQGSFAELCAIDECWLYPTPDDVSDDAAAACALVGITAHLGLFRDAKLKAGEILFVNGGSGGVGSMVVQMAKAAGAKVVATAGSDEKADVCRKLGADLVVNYKTQDVTAAVKEFAPQGVQVVWETQREPNFDNLVACLGERGRLILMAGRDARPPFPVGPFYVKGCSLLGFVMFKATPDEQREAARGINNWLSEKKIAANVAKVFPLAESRAAHELQEANTLHKAGTLSGKIVLHP